MPDKIVMDKLSQILPICKRYFDALQTGDDLLGVM